MTADPTTALQLAISENHVLKQEVARLTAENSRFRSVIKRVLSWLSLLAPLAKDKAAQIEAELADGCLKATDETQKPL